MTPERKKKIEIVLNKRQGGMVVVLENVSDPHNISAVMRSCDATGVQDLCILNTIIPKHDQYSTHSSASARKWVTTHDYTEVGECMSTLRSQGFTILTSHLESEAHDLYDLDLRGDIALVFGNERDGISDELLSHADQNFIIPQVGMVQSLNISVACAVTLYEAYRQRQLAGLYDQPSLSTEQYAQLYDKWSENKKNRRGKRV